MRSLFQASNLNKRTKFLGKLLAVPKSKKLKKVVFIKEKTKKKDMNEFYKKAELQENIYG